MIAPPSPVPQKSIPIVKSCFFRSKQKALTAFIANFFSGHPCYRDSRRIEAFIHHGVGPYHYVAGQCYGAKQLCSGRNINAVANLRGLGIFSGSRTYIDAHMDAAVLPYLGSTIDNHRAKVGKAEPLPATIEGNGKPAAHPEPEMPPKNMLSTQFT